MIQKRYIKTRNTMKVTFKVDFARKAEQVEVLGDFTGWQPIPLKRNSRGIYQTSVELEPGKRYQYRYRIDGHWANDWAADDYTPNGLGDDNSVVIC
jgi:1,4-alpha-glucan branching enzyme